MSADLKKTQKVKELLQTLKNQNQKPVLEIEYRLADLNQAMREIKFNLNNNISIKARRIA